MSLAMSKGFTVKQTINRPPRKVWSFLTDMRNADQWMTGVENMRPVAPGPIGVGSRFSFTARGAERETEVCAFEPSRKIALKSTQGGVTAVYEYSITPNAGASDVELRATCEARGLWKVLYPIILVLMRKSDAGHLVQLRNAIERQAP
ncbi:MAG: SRPBCC family protein [Acidiferrobacterales bacterium]